MGAYRQNDYGEEDLRQAYDVKEVEVFFGLTQEIWADPTKFKEALQFLGLVVIDKLPGWAENLPPDIEMKFKSQNLLELGITIEHNKPRK